MNYDLAYANAFIPDADAYPPPLDARSGGFSRGPGTTRPDRHPLWSPKPPTISTSLPEAAPQGLLVFIPRRLLAEVRSRHLVPSGGGRTQARMGLRHPLLHARARSPDRRDDPGDRERRRRGCEPRRRSGRRCGTLRGRASQRANGLRRCDPVDHRQAGGDDFTACGSGTDRFMAMNADLRLDPEEIAAESPARLALRRGVEAHVWVGAAGETGISLASPTLVRSLVVPLDAGKRQAPLRRHRRSDQSGFGDAVGLC